MIEPDPDPLAKITLTPRTFIALLATLALLLGLTLALIPVHIPTPDPINPTTVSCGNTIGGVEPDTISANLSPPDRPTLVSYIDICERAISHRQFYSWPLFFLGGLTIIYLGVVRHPTISPTHTTPQIPTPEA